MSERISFCCFVFIFFVVGEEGGGGGNGDCGVESVFSIIMVFIGKISLFFSNHNKTLTFV